MAELDAACRVTLGACSVVAGTVGQSAHALRVNQVCRRKG